MGVHVVAGLEGHRQEELRLPVEPREPGRKHADHHVRLSVEAERAPEHAAIASEPRAPEAIGEDDPPVRAPDLVAPIEPRGPGPGSLPGRGTLRGDDGGLEPFGLIASGEHHRAVVIARRRR